MENDILSNDADIRTRQVIDANKHKYSISAMCKNSKYSRQTTIIKRNKSMVRLEEIVQEEFIRNENTCRKLKKCYGGGLQLSRRRISRIMKHRGPASTYTIAPFWGNEQLVLKRKQRI